MRGEQRGTVWWAGEEALMLLLLFSPRPALLSIVRRFGESTSPRDSRVVACVFRALHSPDAENNGLRDPQHLWGARQRRTKSTGLTTCN